jgi:hypothetical protein
VSKVVQQTTLLDRSSTMEQRLYSSLLEKYWKPRFVNRHPPIGKEDRTYYGFKR